MRSALLALPLAAAACAPLPAETREVQQAVPSPCTLDLVGIGNTGVGWIGLRKDGTLWETPFGFAGLPAEQRGDLGADNLALSDSDGEAIHYCAIKQGGAVVCWGANDHGQLGAGFVSPQELAPQPVAGLPGAAVSVTVGIDHTCALVDGGDVYCWGGSAYGQVGDGSTGDVLAPALVLSGATAVSAGFVHTCALGTSGAVHCWGDNLYGEVGNGTFSLVDDPVTTPTQVFTGALQMSAGGFFSCAVTTAHELYCWGDNVSGHLGVGDTTNRNLPTLVAGLGAAVAEVDTSVRAGCARKLDGSVWCWGWQGSGRLGNGVDADANQLAPVPVSGPLGAGGAERIWLVEGAGCARRTDGTLACWGAGSFLDGGGASAVPVDVDFCGLPTLTAATPGFGSIVGGTSVTLTGTELDPAVQVSFGDEPAASVTWVDATQVIAVTPNFGYADTVDILIENPGAKKARLVDAFTFLEPPDVYQADPMLGPAKGGTPVTLLGSRFQAGVTVSFGGAPATAVTVVDDKTLDVVTPPHAAGVVDVVVENPDGQTDTLAMGFTYVPAPAITSLDPTSGPAAGDNDVTILGEGFDPTCTVTFGGEPSPEVVFYDETQLVVAVPPHAPGVVDVTVERADGELATAAGAYTYLDDGSGGAGGSPGGCACSAPARGQPRGALAAFAAAFALAARQRRARLLGSRPKPAR